MNGTCIRMRSQALLHVLEPQATPAPSVLSQGIGTTQHEPVVAGMHVVPCSPRLQEPPTETHAFGVAEEQNVPSAPVQARSCRTSALAPAATAPFQ